MGYVPLPFRPGLWDSSHYGYTLPAAAEIERRMALLKLNKSALPNWRA
ncbi:hypothetical protein RAA17_14110 [Komagataeibacter rhaeticus]|nr:hypothetical protein [Komagataeibacter rhaeticus]